MVPTVVKDYKIVKITKHIDPNYFSVEFKKDNKIIKLMPNDFEIYINNIKKEYNLNYLDIYKYIKMDNYGIDTNIKFYEIKENREWIEEEQPPECINYCYDSFNDNLLYSEDLPDTITELNLTEDDKKKMINQAFCDIGGFLTQVNFVE
jgi:hypothetical protein